MNPQNEVGSFFTQVISTKSKRVYLDKIYLSFYICANEFGWTQKDIEETEIPFLLMLLETRTEVSKEQERQNKKRK